jgi:hypothetical protein
MSKKGGGKSQAQLDARSRSLNSRDAIGQAALANQGAQRSPGTPAFKAIQDNRSVQLNPPPPGSAPRKPSTPTTSEGPSSSNSG